MCDDGCFLVFLPGQVPQDGCDALLRAARSRRCDDEQGSPVYCGAVRTSKIGSRQLAKASRWRCADASMLPFSTFPRHRRFRIYEAQGHRFLPVGVITQSCAPKMHPRTVSTPLGFGRARRPQHKRQRISISASVDAEASAGVRCANGAGLSVIMKRPRKAARLIELVRKNSTTRVLSKAETTMCVPE